MEYKISVRGEVELEKLTDDVSIRAEAKRLLPSTIDQYAEHVGEVSYTAVQEMLSGVNGLTLNQSSETKEEYCKENARRWKESLTEENKQEIEDQLFNNIKEAMEAQK